MAKYAYYDSTVKGESKVIGWIDTDAYPSFPLPNEQDLYALTALQWDNRLTGHWAITDGTFAMSSPRTLDDPPPTPIARTNFMSTGPQVVQAVLLPVQTPVPTPEHPPFTEHPPPEPEPSEDHD